MVNIIQGLVYPEFRLNLKEILKNEKQPIPYVVACACVFL